MARQQIIIAKGIKDFLVFGFLFVFGFSKGFSVLPHGELIKRMDKM